MRRLNFKSVFLGLILGAISFGVFQNCQPVPFEVDASCTDPKSSVAAGSVNESLTINYPSKNGDAFFFDDMILSAASFSTEQKSLDDDVTADANSRSNPITRSYWPNNTIPIAVSIFGPSMFVYSNADLLRFKDLVFATCRHYARFVNIQCIERTNQTTYLDAKLAAANDAGAICRPGAMGCADYPDRDGARLYTVIEGHLNTRKFYHLHEMGHSLGLGHEFNNSALENIYEYPATGTIDLANIPWSLWPNFGVNSVPYVTIRQNYDPGSVMNYAIPIAEYGGRLKNQEQDGHMYFITNQFDKILGQKFLQDDTLFLVTQGDADGLKAIYGANPNSQKICRNPVTNQLAYEFGTVAYFFPNDVADSPGEACMPEGRVCESNGVLSGTAAYAKCKTVCKTADGQFVPFSENIKHGIKMAKIPNGGQKVLNPALLKIVYKKQSESEYIEKQVYCDSAGKFKVFGINNELENESSDSEIFYLNTTPTGSLTPPAPQNEQSFGSQPPCKK